MGYRMAKKKPVAKQAPKKQAIKPVKVLAPKQSAKVPFKVPKTPVKTPVKAPVVAKPTRKPAKKPVKPLMQEPLTEVLSAPPATLPVESCLQPIPEVTGDVEVCPVVVCKAIPQERPIGWPPDPHECER